MNTVAHMETVAVQGDTFKVNPHKGEVISKVSSQWFSRPDDQRFLSLSELESAVHKRSAAASQEIVDVKSIYVDADRNNPDALTLGFNNVTNISPNHWSFGQLSSLAGAPAEIGRAHV